MASMQTNSLNLESPLWCPPICFLAYIALQTTTTGRNTTAVLETWAREIIRDCCPGFFGRTSGHQAVPSGKTQVLKNAIHKFSLFGRTAKAFLLAELLQHLYRLAGQLHRWEDWLTIGTAVILPVPLIYMSTPKTIKVPCYIYTALYYALFHVNKCNISCY